MCIYVCTDTCTDMCIDMHTDMHIDMRIDMHTDMHIDMCIDMHTDMHMNVYIEGILRYWFWSTETLYRQRRRHIEFHIDMRRQCIAHDRVGDILKGRFRHKSVAKRVRICSAG